MDPIDPRVMKYLDDLVPDRPEAMRAMEERAAETDFPIVGPAAGQFMYAVARSIGARRIFELGSGFGYSTAWFARAVKENGGGVVHHTVWDEALSREARERLDQLGCGDVVEYRVSEAVAALRETDGPFDLVFNDIDKQGYPESLDVIEEKIRPGGVLLVDNLLWHGRILDESDDSPATNGVRELTRRVMGGAGWAASIVPIRDGVLFAVRT